LKRSQTVPVKGYALACAYIYICLHLFVSLSLFRVGRRSKIAEISVGDQRQAFFRRVSCFVYSSAD
jgi:hypothetical protein